MASVTVAISVVAMSLGCVSPVEAPMKEMTPPECSPASLLGLGTLDVAIAIDNSLTTQVPSGIDVDGDGIVGVLESSVYTDHDDSLLGLQLTAIRKLIHETRNHDIKYSILTYSGFPLNPSRMRDSRAVHRLNARTLVKMTDDPTRLEAALSQIERDSSRGSSQFYAGLRRASESLIEAKDRERKSKKMVLFLADRPGWLSHADGRIVKNRINAKTAVAVEEAKKNNITFNTFGLTEISVDWERVSLGLVAAMTGGTYHAIDSPEQLYCHLVDALLPAPEERETASPAHGTDLGL